MRFTVLTALVALTAACGAPQTAQTNSETNLASNAERIAAMMVAYREITGSEAVTSVGGSGQPNEGIASGPFIRFLAIAGAEMGTVMMLNGRLTAVIELSERSAADFVRSAVGSLPEAFEDIVFIPKIPRDPRHNSKIDYEKLRVMLSRKN